MSVLNHVKSHIGAGPRRVDHPTDAVSPPMAQRSDAAPPAPPADASASPHGATTPDGAARTTRPRLRGSQPGSTAKRAVLVGGGLVVVALIVFIAQNAGPVPVSFVSLHGRFPLVVLLLAGLLIGAVAALASTGRRHAKHSDGLYTSRFHRMIR